MTSVGCNFLCGHPNVAEPPSACAHLSLTPFYLRVDVINGWPLRASAHVCSSCCLGMVELDNPTDLMQDLLVSLHLKSLNSEWLGRQCFTFLQFILHFYKSRGYW